MAVAYTTRNRDAFDQARKGSDYVTSAGVLTIPAGETTATIPVTVLGDLVPELDEPFEVVLLRPSGATIGDGTAAAVLLNDDPVRLPLR